MVAGVCRWDQLLADHQEQRQKGRRIATEIWMVRMGSSVLEVESEVYSGTGDQQGKHEQLREIEVEEDLQ